MRLNTRNSRVRRCTPLRSPPCAAGPTIRHPVQNVACSTWIQLASRSSQGGATRAALSSPTLARSLWPTTPLCALALAFHPTHPLHPHPHPTAFCPSPCYPSTLTIPAGHPTIDTLSCPALSTSRRPTLSTASPDSANSPCPSRCLHPILHVPPFHLTCMLVLPALQHCPQIAEGGLVVNHPTPTSTPPNPTAHLILTQGHSVQPHPLRLSAPPRPCPAPPHPLTCFFSWSATR